MVILIHSRQRRGHTCDVLFLCEPARTSLLVVLTSCRSIWTFGLNAWLQTSPTLQTRENGRTGLDQENKI